MKKIRKTKLRQLMFAIYLVGMEFITNCKKDFFEFSARWRISYSVDFDVIGEVVR